MLKRDPPVRFPPPHLILVVSDIALVREGVRRVAEGLLGPVQCIEATDGDSMALALQAGPALSFAVLDLGVPRLAGARLAQLAQQHPGIGFVLLSDLTPHEAARLMAQAPGVMACLPRRAPLAQMRAGIEAALAGRPLVPALVGDADRGQPAGLTARQAEVLALLQQGLSNKVIASRLGLAEGTVKNHVSALLRLLKARNRTQAARQRDER